jgi:hypothetical protein
MSGTNDGCRSDFFTFALEASGLIFEGARSQPSHSPEALSCDARSLNPPDPVSAGFVGNWFV